MTPGLVGLGFCHPGEQKACFTNSLLDLMFYDASHSQRVVGNKFGLLSQEAGTDQVYAARNTIARNFLQSDAEWLFFIDSDMGFDADTIDRLVTSADPVERPIVGGLAFAMKSDGSGPMFARRYRCSPTIYLLRGNEDESGFLPMFDYPRDALVECDATGMACVLIHRTVLERIAERYGPAWFRRAPIPTKPDDDFGEDLSFCLRAKACEFPIYVDTSVKTTHDKGGVFFDEETYELQEAFRRLAS